MKYFFLFCISLLLSIAAVGIYFFRTPILQFTKPLPPGVVTHFSTANAPSESLKGTIASFSGEVAFESRTATAPAKLTSTQTLQQGEELVTKNGTAKLIFPGLTITLMQNADLTVLQTLPSHIVFGQNNGTIEYKQSTAEPIAIQSTNLLIQQNSGDIKITVDKDKQTVTAQVITGSATAAYNDTNNTSQVIAISQGKKLTFDNQNLATTVKNNK